MGPARASSFRAVFQVVQPEAWESGGCRRPPVKPRPTDEEMPTRPVRRRQIAPLSGLAWCLCELIHHVAFTDRVLVDCLDDGITCREKSP